ncbi:MAG: hypothetical protein AB1560_00755 [Pseudomonadota bacterium]
MIKVNTFYVPLLLGMLTVFVTRYGVAGGAYAAMGTSVIMTPVFLCVMKHSVIVRILIFLHAIIRPLRAFLVMALILRWALPAYERSISIQYTAYLLIGSVLVGVLVYAGTVALLGLLAGRPVSTERHVLERIRITV